jgi:PAS domain S-box-containing protein
MRIGWFLGLSGIPNFIQTLVSEQGRIVPVPVLVILLSLMGPAAALLAKAGRGTLAGLWLTAIPSLGAVAAVLASNQLGATPFYCGVGLVVALATLQGCPLKAALGSVVASMLAIAALATWLELDNTAPSHSLVGALVAVLLMVAVAMLHAQAFQLTLREVASQQTRAAELEARYRLIAENTADLVELIDASNVVVYASPSFRRVLGADPTGANAARDSGPDADGLLSLLNLAREGQVARTELRRPRVDGTMGRFECVASPVVGTGMVLVVARDVTAERAMATDLEHAKKMEALGRFAGSIAHDFNNLLSVMRTCTTLASHSVPRDSAAQADLNDVQDAISRASELTSQLLAFSRRDVVVPVRTDVSAVLARGAELAQRLVGQRVEVALDVEAEVWSMWCGRGQLDQIVMNLAANARDAMPEGGTLSLSAKNAPASLIGDAVLLRIRDTGTGLSAEAKAHLFEPFFTTKAPGIGTGLGLATVFGIVKALGGLIEVASEEGKGTEFRIWLPRASEGPLAAPPAMSPPRRQRSPNESMVLVVDDDADVRSLMVRLIAAEGFQVLSAADADQALALSLSLSELPVLVTDVMLPGKDGLWLSKRLLERFPSLKVVLVSGFAPDPMAAARLVSQGAKFVQKPFQPGLLVSSVKDCLGWPARAPTPWPEAPVVAALAPASHGRPDQA